MEHLPIHLAGEALMAGPVQFRWMYPIERYMTDVETKEYRQSRNNEGKNSSSQTLGKGRKIVLDRVSITHAHKYIELANSEVIAPFRDLHQRELSNTEARASRKRDS
ncbi:hypothetical protein LIER_38625 [Lithospermum erythrorhizon]|uniref:DUF4218 domain-containing protein n=1 Tax=Lithospermum erythrorhizon TaxID=34254 RepID=A0AAV3Q561_LITER